MVEQQRQIDSQALQQKALVITTTLKEVAETHKRKYPSSIDVVWVFSGPGTYNDELKNGQQKYQRWMDRDRIRAGVAVVSEVTAARVYEAEGRTIEITQTDPITKKVIRKKVPIRGVDVTQEDIQEYGPLFVYNGTEVENQEIRKALNSPHCKLPKGKVLLIDEVKEPNSVFAIRHTGDQYNSFYQEMANPFSPLHQAKQVALVAHIPDFVRHPFYAQRYNQEHIARGGNPIEFFAYALRSRRGSTDPKVRGEKGYEDTEELHMNSELPRLVTYAQRGDLAPEPIGLNILRKN